MGRMKLDKSEVSRLKRAKNNFLSLIQLLHKNVLMHFILSTGSEKWMHFMKACYILRNFIQRGRLNSCVRKTRAFAVMSSQHTVAGSNAKSAFCSSGSLQFSNCSAQRSISCGKLRKTCAFMPPGTMLIHGLIACHFVAESFIPMSNGSMMHCTTVWKGWKKLRKLAQGKSVLLDTLVETLKEKKSPKRYSPWVEEVRWFCTRFIHLAHSLTKPDVCAFLVCWKMRVQRAEFLARHSQPPEEKKHFGHQNHKVDGQSSS